MLEGRLLKSSAFRGFGCERAYMLGDGSCFFHSLACIFDLRTVDATQHFCDEATSWKQRQTIGHRLRKYVVETAYGPWLDAVPWGLSMLEARDPATYVDEALICCTSRALRINIYIIQSRDCIYFYNTDSPWTVVLAHTLQQQHFEPILCEKFSSPSVVPLKTGPQCCVLPNNDPLFSSPLFMRAIRR